MALQTVNGFTPARVGPSGMFEFASGQPMAAADLVNDLKEAQEPARWGLLAGVLAGGVCTAALLVVTIPIGTYYYARGVWFGASNSTVTVANSTTTYIWGCSNGTLQQTATAVPPGGYDNRTACLLCKVVAAAGVATVDNTVQHAARQTDAVNRFVQDGPLRIDYANKRVVAVGAVPVMQDIPTGAAVDVPAGYQQRWFGTVTIEGTLTVEGNARIDT